MRTASLVRIAGFVTFSLLILAVVGRSNAQPTAPDVVAILKGHGDAIDTVTLSPDGAVIATGSFDKTIRLWDAATGKELRVLEGKQGHQGQVLAVAFAPKGHLIASGGADNTAKIWEGPGGAAAPKAVAGIAAVLSVPAAGVASGEFLPPAQQAVPRSRFLSAEPIKTFPHPNLVDAVAFDESGTQLATGCHDGILRIWDVEKATALKTINAHVQTMTPVVGHPIYSVTWVPGGKQILTTSYDHTIKLWDVASGNLVKEFKAAANPVSESKAEAPKEPIGHRDQVFTAAFTKDGKFFATGSSDRTAKLWDVASGKVVRDFINPNLKPEQPGEPAPSHPGWVQVVRFTPDDQFLVTVGPAPRHKGYIGVWSVADGKLTAGQERDFGPLYGLAIAPDGSKLILGCGPKSRLAPEAEGVILKMPGR